MMNHTFLILKPNHCQDEYKIDDSDSQSNDEVVIPLWNLSKLRRHERANQCTGTVASRADHDGAIVVIVQAHYDRESLGVLDGVSQTREEVRESHEREGGTSAIDGIRYALEDSAQRHRLRPRVSLEICGTCFGKTYPSITYNL